MVWAEPSSSNYCQVHLGTRRGEFFRTSLLFCYFTNKYCDSEFVKVPLGSVELFLKKLSNSNIEVGEYIPDITWTDDYPDINM